METGEDLTRQLYGKCLGGPSHDKALFLKDKEADQQQHYIFKANDEQAKLENSRNAQKKRQDQQNLYSENRRIAQQRKAETDQKQLREQQLEQQRNSQAEEDLRQLCQKELELKSNLRQSQLQGLNEQISLRRTPQPLLSPNKATYNRYTPQYNSPTFQEKMMNRHSQFEARKLQQGEIDNELKEKQRVRDIYNMNQELSRQVDEKKMRRRQEIQEGYEEQRKHQLVALREREIEAELRVRRQREQELLSRNLQEQVRMKQANSIGSLPRRSEGQASLNSIFSKQPPVESTRGRGRGFFSPLMYAGSRIFS